MKKYALMILDIVTPALYETKAAIDNTTGVFKGVVIVAAVILMAVWFLS